ncbi:glycoside hydrolase [Podospora fimiseda]|uniref:alpha-1,2-Mannosidase n=1 Tax=Podospora fimiseda TaxID=252190 RepID=A0AAN7BVA8_9PEZI|nr:glycoside hydrolase [Podospora fimiseda]
MPQRIIPRVNGPRVRIRTLILGGAFFATIWYLLQGLKLGDVSLESVRLEKHMNSGPLSHPYKFVKSSVDWGKLTPKYPPEKPFTPLPPAVSSRRIPKLPRVQHQFGPETGEFHQKRHNRRVAVRQLAVKSWNAYRTYAWKKDALLPLSGAGRDQFSGWAATLVDSLDTLWIMGMRDEFDEAIAAVAEIDFGKSTTPNVNIFETNIRYLGGLLAAYDLSKREILLQKAIELGDLIYAGFDTKNRMPVDNILLGPIKAGEGLQVEPQVVSASPGTLSLEMARLSQLTGNPKYYSAISRITDLFHAGQNQTALPGLFPMWVSMSKGDVISGNTFTLAGCVDSLYEYFPKMHFLFSGAEPKYLALTRNFLSAAKKYLLFRPFVPQNDDILMAGNRNVDIQTNNPYPIDPETEHLACFIGGTYALAGRLLSSPEDVSVGAKLTRGCVYAYKSFPTGIMPERLNMAYKSHLPKGFTTAKDARYILRPEAIESVFYMWRITGEQEWQEAAWDMFKAVERGTRTEKGAASVVDVTVQPGDIEREDYMESFWIAETLKYFYLVFSPPDIISLDKYVLNTEAHPFLRPAV